MPVTMREVAQKAGVSIKTVSRVVNEQGEISEATRERVLAAIGELGYRPSRIARAMVTQRTRTVGFIIPDITNPFFSEVARGIQDTAQANGYNVFICNTEEDPAEHLQILYSLADQGVDGLIIFSSVVGDEDLNHFADSFRPIVAINRLTDHPHISRIIVDNYRGARLAVDHLVARGHTAVGMLSGPSGISLGRIRRVEGFCDGLAAHGLPLRDEWLVKVPPGMSHGREAVHRLLTGYPEITALFCYNDLLALGAIRACRDLGRRVPEDCAIVGFDDIQ
ncbi:MAG: LacI family DNA-binding transcriptional regulator, partial [Chloroflexota bacterium]